MGFLDKMKNLFTEEVEEEESKPQKKETRTMETTTPRRETVVAREPVMTVTESKTEENKEKFVFPVYFDDKDFDDLEKPKAKEKPKATPKEQKKEPYQGAKVTLEPEPKKIFKPSPIISPVYGVLDKNYSKEDITTKKDSSRAIARNSRSSHVTVDDIRNKAYGILEDDLESTLFDDLSDIGEDSKYDVSNQEALDIFNELDFDTITEKKDESYEKLEENILLDKAEVDDDTEQLARQLEEQKKKLEEINQYMNDAEPLDEAEEEKKEREETKEDSVDDTPNEESNLNDSELFDLIDSMYEKREEE